jgi:hypothetical protein
MKTSALLSIVILAFVADVIAADIGKFGWNAANIDVSRGADRNAVTRFVNSNLPPDWMEIPPYSVGESAWAHVGGGSYDLLVPLDISGRGYSNTLIVYSQTGVGNTRSQVIYGWKIGNTKQRLRDLNGDGVDELVIPKEPGQRGSWSL